jgi:hypothetical protein
VVGDPLGEISVAVGDLREAVVECPQRPDDRADQQQRQQAADQNGHDARRHDHGDGAVGGGLGAGGGLPGLGVDGSDHLVDLRCDPVEDLDLILGDQPVRGGDPAPVAAAVVVGDLLVEFHEPVEQRGGLGEPLVLGGGQPGLVQLGNAPFAGIDLH